MTLFHQNITILRKKKKLSQEELAERYGLSQSGFGRYEKNVEPSYKILIDLAAFFKVSIDALLTIDFSQEGIPFSSDLLHHTTLSEKDLTPEQMQMIERILEELQDQKTNLNTLTKIIQNLKNELDKQNEEIQRLKKQ